MKIRIYYEDTDCGDMVYHSNYLNFCERARSELFFKKGLLPHSNSEFFVVKSCKANWKKAASIIMKQEIFRQNELIFEAEFKLAFLKSGKPAKIPSKIFEILEN